MKKTLSLLLCSLLLAAALALPALAQMPAAADPCPKCGEGTLQQLETAYSPWGTVDTIVCKYHPNHKDSIMERTATYYWRCDHCEALYPYTETESRTVHLHHKYYQQKLRNGML